MRGIERVAADTASRRRGRHLINPVNTNDLLDQIDLALQVHSRRWNPKRRRRDTISRHSLETKPGERSHLFIR